jgi:quinol monooxygenase YgiN
MIGLELTIGAGPSSGLEMQQSLENLGREALAADSCQECRVFKDLQGGDRFLWLQWWRSQPELEQHFQSTAFRTLLGAIKVLGNLESARVVELQDSTSLMGAFLADRVDTNDSTAARPWREPTERSDDQ